MNGAQPDELEARSFSIVAGTIGSLAEYYRCTFLSSGCFSPYIEPQAYILRDDSDSGFLQLDNVSDSNDQDFKAAYQIEIEFPNKVTLFAKDDTPKPVLDTQSKSFYERYVKPRDAELTTARWQSLERASATALLPPLALILLGLVIGWIVSGFKSQKS